MKLETAKKGTKKNPEREDIEKAILDDEVRGEFAILSKGVDEFVQVAGESEPFQLEFREGASGSIWATSAPVSRSDVLSVFLGYHEQSSDWKSAVDWSELDF